MKGKLTTRITALEQRAEREARLPPQVFIHDGRKLPAQTPRGPGDPPNLHVYFRSKAGIVEGGKLVHRDAVKKRKSKQQKRRTIQ